MKVRVAAVVMVVLVAGSCGDGSESPGPDSTTSSPSAGPTTTGGTFDLAPGRIGPVEVGMTIDEALATGAVERTEPEPDPPCPLPTLRWKAPHTDKLHMFDADGEIAVLGTDSPDFTTPEGLGVGSTWGEIQAVWGGAKLRESPAFGHLVDRTDGNKWLAFAFFEEDDEVTDASKVIYAEVTVDERPVAFPDGC